MSLIDNVKKYYATRASVYDETAGYNNQEAEKMRAPIKARYRDIFRGRCVLEIACGTGYWTEVIGEVSKSVLATDIDSSMMALAEKRCQHLSNVNFQITDAYSLDEIQGKFDATFSHWWWSHIPKRYLPIFLSALHSKLVSDATVLFVDQLPYESIRTQDSEGNTLEQRMLPDGDSFNIVKNFPTKQEITDYLKDIAYDIQYIEYPEEMSWNVLYKKK